MIRDGGGRARGIFQVERGRGWLRNAVASLLGFPRAGVNVPVTLEVSSKRIANDGAAGSRRRPLSRRSGNMIIC